MLLHVLFRVETLSRLAAAACLNPFCWLGSREGSGWGSSSSLAPQVQLQSLAGAKVHPRAGHGHILAAPQSDQFAIPAQGMAIQSLTATLDIHQALRDTNRAMSPKISMQPLETQPWVTPRAVSLPPSKDHLIPPSARQGIAVIYCCQWDQSCTKHGERQGTWLK